MQNYTFKTFQIPHVSSATFSYCSC